MRLKRCVWYIYPMNMNLINHINSSANDYVQLNSCGCWIVRLAKPKAYGKQIYGTTDFGPLTRMNTCLQLQCVEILLNGSEMTSNIEMFITKKCPPRIMQMFVLHKWYQAHIKNKQLHCYITVKLQKVHVSRGNDKWSSTRNNCFVWTNLTKKLHPAF